MPKPKSSVPCPCPSTANGRSGEPVEKVAKHLGNTPTICRRCYIHPAVLEGYLDGSTLQALAENTRKYLAENIDGLSAEEAPVTAFLRLRLDELAEQNRSRSAPEIRLAATA